MVHDHASVRVDNSAEPFLEYHVSDCFKEVSISSLCPRNPLTEFSRSPNLADVGTTSCAGVFLQTVVSAPRTEGRARGHRGRLSVGKGAWVRGESGNRAGPDGYTGRCRMQ